MRGSIQTECCAHAVHNYLSLAEKKDYDFFTYLRKNHKISDLVSVLTTICTAEDKYALLTRAHYWSILVTRRIPIHHIFVIKGSHVYNIAFAEEQIRVIDTIYDRRETITMPGLVDELRTADLAIFILPSWAAAATSNAAVKLS